MSKSAARKSPAGRKARAGEAGTPITVRLTSDERAQYDKAAASEEMSLAEWIRAACTERLTRKRR
ncbi:MAG: hypothetical protein JO257_22465 [Deltaproteobacteria bacterium]|nr:hypothetical protein [Deltaproteobacteria bacterium]